MMNARILAEAARIPMSDGIWLTTDVIRPDVGGQLPVLLVRTPYSRAAYRAGHDVLGAARAGWAVVVVDVRGRFESPGEFFAFEQEVVDGHACVDWAARQPWSSGAVAMTGMSYLAMAQWGAAAACHPALRAINPVLGCAGDPSAWAYEGELFQVGLVGSWLLGVVATSGTLPREVRQRAVSLAADWRTAFASPADADPLSELSPIYRKWRNRTPPQIGAAADSNLIPSFEVAGWFDPFCDQMLADYERRRSSAPNVARKLIVGPWSHEERLYSRYPELDLGITGDGSALQIAERGLEWIAAAIRGTGRESGIECYITGSGEWRSYITWPPPAQERALYLAAGDQLDDRRSGVLLAAPLEFAGRHRYCHDPHNPVPTWGGRALGPYLPMPGPCDQRSVLGRSDVLTFVSEPLRQPLTVVGMAGADLFLDSHKAIVDVHLKVSDGHPDGRIFGLSDSGIRTRVVAGQSCRVPAGSLAHTFLSGHRIVAQVCSSNFPRLELWQQKADMGVLSGPATPSRLVLPVSDP